LEKRSVRVVYRSTYTLGLGVIMHIAAIVTLVASIMMIGGGAQAQEMSPEAVAKTKAFARVMHGEAVERGCGSGGLYRERCRPWF
jgi:hypothetical protein